MRKRAQGSQVSVAGTPFWCCIVCSLFPQFPSQNRSIDTGNAGYFRGGPQRGGVCLDDLVNED